MPTIMPVRQLKISNITAVLIGVIFIPIKEIYNTISGIIVMESAKDSINRSVKDISPIRKKRKETMSPGRMRISITMISLITIVKICSIIFL
jgi:hypothetical protein